RSRKNIQRQLEQMFDELNRIYRGIYLTGEFTARTRDLVTSFGERLSCTIIAAYFDSQKLRTRFCDARELIKTDAHFGEANVDFSMTNRQIKKYFSASKGITVVTGFISSSKENITTTL